MRLQHPYHRLTPLLKWSSNGRRMLALTVAIIILAEIPVLLNIINLQTLLESKSTSDDVVASIVASKPVVASKHIVVAHCNENLAWLDQLRSYDPLVCQRCHIHIYSKCGMGVDLEQTIPAVAECSTLHRAMNFGTQEYAFFAYIQDMWDSMPPLISFIQAGAITENPHVIYDILGPDLPGLSYRGLARHVRQAWHFLDYEKEENKAEAEIVSRNFEYLFNHSSWVTDWRAMFTASRAQIRQNPWNAYSFINDKLAHGECSPVNCNMELLFATFFGCYPSVFEGDPSCSTGVYANLSLVVTEEDFMKDSYMEESGIAGDFQWQICGNKTILYSESSLNGDLICLDNPNGISVESIRHLLEEMIIGDTWRVDVSNETFHKEPQWYNHKAILRNQNQGL